MIVSEMSTGRALIGRLETGQEIVDSIRDLSVRRRVETGYFSGFGYVRNPTIRLFRPLHRRYLKATEELRGEYLATQVSGTVSFHKDARELNVTAILVDVESRETFMGELLDAEVISFEFQLTAFDGVRLFRDEDPRTGLRQWVMMEMLENQKPKKRKLTAKPAQEIVEEEEPELDPGEVELVTGDFLEHPRLGLCEVVDLADESRIAIRIPTGRVVELHRRIVHLAFSEQKEDHKVFSVSIRRKG